jgi:lycopene beta-cyclase
VPILLLEGEPSFGGNHLWSFFDPDIAPADRWLVEPLVAARWDEYEVRFPRRHRVIATGYASCASARLDAEIRSRLRPDQYRLNAAIAQIGPDFVRLADGERIGALSVIDARGFAALPADQRASLDLAWQKFVGREYRLETPHDVARPVIMDATVAQHDGYRFVYTLPFASDRLLVEDTYYASSPALDVGLLGRRIDDHVGARGWRVAGIERAEKGVLPVALGGDFARFRPRDVPPRIGVMGGFFHPTTGYSLPDAVRVALLVAGLEWPVGAALAAAIDSEARRLWRDRRFYRLLNRMLFRAAAPDERYRVLEHFYRLESDRVGRFYAARSGLWDKLRILSGKPPVPIGRALAALRR